MSRRASERQSQQPLRPPLHPAAIASLSHSGRLHSAAAALAICARQHAALSWPTGSAHHSAFGLLRAPAQLIPKDLDISNGHMVCLDNIGGCTDQETLRSALYSKFPGLRVRDGTAVPHTGPHRLETAGSSMSRVGSFRHPLQAPRRRSWQLSLYISWQPLALHVSSAQQTLHCARSGTALCGHPSGQGGWGVGHCARRLGMPALSLRQRRRPCVSPVSPSRLSSLHAKLSWRGVVAGGASLYPAVESAYGSCLELRQASDGPTCRLQRLYLVGASPGPPRPLLAHWPRWREQPWGDGPKAEMLGHLKLQHTASAHFVQVFQGLYLSADTGKPCLMQPWTNRQLYIVEGSAIDQSSYAIHSRIASSSRWRCGGG